jgi:hypothetical protein
LVHFFPVLVSWTKKNLATLGESAPWPKGNFSVPEKDLKQGRGVTFKNETFSRAGLTDRRQGDQTGRENSPNG